MSAYSFRSALHKLYSALNSGNVVEQGQCKGLLASCLTSYLYRVSTMSKQRAFLSCELGEDVHHVVKEISGQQIETVISDIVEITFNNSHGKVLAVIDEVDALVAAYRYKE